MPRFLNGVDWILLLTAIFLSAVGVLMIYSASIEADGVDLTFVFRQIVFIVFGVLSYIIITKIDYRILAQISFFLYAAVVGILLLTLFLGENVRGSVRWIDLGLITVQASEIAKPVLILTLAAFFSKYPPENLRNIFVSLFIALLPAGLVFLQPDLGNTVILLGIWATLVFAAGIKLWHIVILATFTGLVTPVIWNLLQNYQKQRVTSFLSPEQDPLGSGYNIVQSIIAVGSGGLTGRGFGRGTQSQLNFLPEQKTDFIFATTAEELGFLGVSIILGSFILIFYRLSIVFNGVKDNLGSLIALGVASLIIIHIFINVGMNIGIFPVTGITLPFLSFGGSSLLSFMIALGLVNSVSVHSGNKKN